MDLVAAIDKRHSVRRYTNRTVPTNTIEKIIQIGQEDPRLRPEIDIRWYMVLNGRMLSRSLEGYAGVYGMFTTAPHYIIAVSQEKPGYMENLGFCMERMILAATDMGLGTCWVGSIFNEEKLRMLIPALESNERIVALTPLGYADTSPGAQIAQQLVRWGTDRLGNRKSLSEIASQYIWSVPWEGEDPTMNDILARTRLAPSWDNTQPWHFVVDDRQVLAAVDRTPQQGNVCAGKPYYRLDGGIAMCHFYLAAQEAGFEGMWRIPEEAETKMLRDRYAVPREYDILSVYAYQH
jgi:nitroreductase